MYRLRAAVTIAAAELKVAVGLGAPPAAGRVIADPRDPRLGWRAYAADLGPVLAGVAPLDPAEMTALRVALGVPETGIELIPDESYVLEMGFERLHGVDFRKGCYVGQEVTARMKHKTELRKGLARVRIAGAAPAPGTPILAEDGRAVGTLHTTAGQAGLANLRFDRAGGVLSAGEARLALEPET
jgi:folate-binding protein YgfZ